MLSEQNQLSQAHSLNRRAVLPEGEALLSLCLACGATVQLPDHRLGLPLLEGLLPDIRLLAMISAARRHRFDDNARTPAQLSDQADWLAARILVLGAKYVQLTADQLPLLRLANQRLRELALAVGDGPACAAAMLLADGASGPVLRFWTADDHDLPAVAGNDPLALSREMARRGRARVAAILRAFGVR